MANNGMIQFVKDIKGNPKACILTEPLWSIPYSLFAPFTTIYMSKIGLSDIQIGTLISVGMIVQVISALFGGALSDKYGRRKTTLVADLIVWSMPCLLWAFAQDYKWFLAAAILNGGLQLSSVSWTALLVEDCDPDKLIYVYSWIQVASVVSVFIAPLSYFLMGIYDVVVVIRCLYLFAFVSMTIKFIILYKCSHETDIGKEKIKLMKNESVFSYLKGYKRIIAEILKSKQMVAALVAMMSYSITNTMIQNFFGLYTTKLIGISDSYLSVFSMVSGAVTLIFMFSFQSTINKLPNKPVMISGYLLFIIGHVILLLCPHGSIQVLISVCLIIGF
jgi:MFS family permease